MTRVFSIACCWLIMTAAMPGSAAAGPPALTGLAVPAQATVRGNVDAEAVLIPPVDARRLFGAEIARRYAVVAVTIANRSADAALLLHGAYIDTSHWALGGPPLSASTSDSSGFGAAAPAQHVSTVEARLVRGQLLDAQQWSARNWTVRVLTAAGSVAAGYSFTLSGSGAAKAIAAFNGTLIPSVNSAWPDGAAQHLNRLSDFGFQTNKVIPKQSADLVVCFFPLDRFLTPAFRKLFLKSAAAFLAPFQMLFDRTMEKDLRQVLGGAPGVPLEELRQAVPAYLAQDAGRAGNPAQTKWFSTLDFLNRCSLHAITVVVEGTFSVDTAAYLPRGVQVRLDSSDLTPGVAHHGSIAGAYLTGGEVLLQEAADYGAQVTTLAEVASDSELPFLLTLSKPVPAGAVLHFSIQKRGALAGSAVSLPPLTAK